MTEDATRDAQEKQRLEQTLASCHQQINSLNMELSEIDSAIEGCKGKDKVYRILGNIMVESDSDKVSKDLEEQRKSIVEKISSIEDYKKKIESKIKDSNN